MKNYKSQKGFTLVELLVAMAIGFVVITTTFLMLKDTSAMVKGGEEVLESQQLGVGAMDYLEEKIKFGKSITPNGSQCMRIKSSTNGIEINRGGTNQSMLSEAYFKPYTVELSFSQPAMQIDTYELVEVTLKLMNTKGEKAYEVVRIVELINSEKNDTARPGTSIGAELELYF